MPQRDEQQGIIVCGHNLNNIIYLDDKLFIADTDRKLHSFMQTVMNESKKKELNINCKKTRQVSQKK